MVSFSTITSTRYVLVALVALWFQVGLVDAARIQRRVPEDADLSTNAKRFAQGLGPISPRNLFTKTHVARAGVSQVPDNRRCIQVSKKNNGGNFVTVGYVSSSYASSPYGGTFKIDNNKSNCLKIDAPTAGGPYDITIYGDNSNSKWLGLGGSDSLTASYLVKSSQTGPNSGPTGSNSGSSSAITGSESRVWNYNSGSNALTAIWKPSNGATVNTRTFATNGDDVLYFVTKQSQFENAASGEYETWLTVVTV